VDDEYMCPNCVTPWRCNGPHIPEELALNLLDTHISFEGKTTTLREVFKLFLTALVVEGESFSGKRPLGNSDWEGALGEGLVEAGIIHGEVTEKDIFFDWDDFNTTLIEAIKQL